ITDPVMHFAPLVFATGNAKYLIAAIPQGHLAGAFGTIAVCIHGFQEPYTVFEAEGLIGKRTHRAHINHVADEIVIERFLDIGGNLSMIATIEYAVNAFIRYLVGYIHATVAKNAARHVQLYIGPQVMFFE